MTSSVEILPAASPRSAGPSRGKHVQTWATDVQTWACCSRAWAQELRRRHPVKTAEAVAAAIGEPPATVRKWLEGRARPGWSAALKLAGVYGPSMLAAAFRRPPAWLDAAVRAERLEAARREHARLTAFLRDDEGTSCFQDIGAVCAPHSTPSPPGGGPDSPPSPLPAPAPTSSR